MPTITNVIAQLTLFLNQKPALAPIITELEKLKNPTPNAEATIIHLRKQLIAFLRSPDQAKDAEGKDIGLANTAHLTLLTLAELKPLNTEDPVTFEEIDPNDKDCVFVSTGHKCSIKSLANHHNTRKPSEQFNDTAENKYLVNFNTNTVFDTFDTIHIMAQAKANGVAFENLRKPAEFRPPLATKSIPRESESAPAVTCTALTSNSVFSSNVSRIRLRVWQQSILDDLQDFGLTGDHLTLLPETMIIQHCVEFHHALKHLMTKRGMLCHTADSAVAQLIDLTPLQARAIAKGLDREDIVNLKNEYQIHAMIKLRDFNIKHWHVRKCINSRVHDEHYCKALIHVVTKNNQNRTADEAATFVSSLTPLEAYGVANGLSREEASSLVDHGQINLYRDYRDAGLTIELLKQCPWDSVDDNKVVEHYSGHNNVPITHTYYVPKQNHFDAALRHLLNGSGSKKMTAEEAVQELQGLSNEQAKRIAYHNETKAQILGQTARPR